MQTGSQPKWDGYRLLVAKDSGRVRLFSKSGTAWTDRLASLAEAFLELPTIFAVLDGEPCDCDDRGRPDFNAVHAEMRQSRPDVSGDGVLSISCFKTMLICGACRSPSASAI